MEVRTDFLATKWLLKFVALFVEVYSPLQLNIRPLGGDIAPGWEPLH